jgi:hypothetical protein
VTPKANWSEAAVAGAPESSSGAMYPGVPERLPSSVSGVSREMPF